MNRKKDHIELAFKSQMNDVMADNRFNYEPLLGSSPEKLDLNTKFLGKKLKIPVWVSSMTGGTDKAEFINKNLATACGEFGMGMGLGSCRMLLEGNTHFQQFNVRHLLGKEQPLFANLGIAQIEKLIQTKQVAKIEDLIHKLNADGLFVHVNPLQEYLQPEGDILSVPPIETIEQLTELTSINIMVKEVGQGMGPESLKRILKTSVSGIEFGAFGGTNFAKLELLRGGHEKEEILKPLSNLGHSAADMLDIINRLAVDCPKKQLIISGGLKTFLDGYYFIKKSKFPAVYGQASMFLKYAMQDYDTLKKFIEYQIKGLQLAYTYLTLKE